MRDPHRHDLFWAGALLVVMCALILAANIYSDAKLNSAQAEWNARKAQR
ncbi:hypothetical protein [Mesoterricola sediminis]|uniref:Uncharacterized protein n=1 Tax=Mesoterricola sediminis TaxID=2927980 RepID=A0AA48HDG8_9BACT|nr:hypothetical protein [Mesoterricola sediminis]BDU76248.1 hypothetical protein METESE_12060 [Mesoterricola sediminis]